MYKWYLLKYFGTFTIFIDRAVIEFQKHQLINHGNTNYKCDKQITICQVLLEHSHQETVWEA